MGLRTSFIEITDLKSCVKKGDMKSFWQILPLVVLQAFPPAEGKYFSISCPVGYTASCQEVGKKEGSTNTQFSSDPKSYSKVFLDNLAFQTKIWNETMNPIIIGIAVTLTLVLLLLAKVSCFRRDESHGEGHRVCTTDCQHEKKGLVVIHTEGLNWRESDKRNDILNLKL